MEIEDLIQNGMVFRNGPSASQQGKRKKKKLSGAQQMRADYKARVAARAAARERRKGERS